jgi:P-type E1-E2 ATPase
LILCAAAIISLILGSLFPEVDHETGEKDSAGWIEGLSIVIAVLLVTVITSTLDWDKSRQFKKLNKADILRAKIRRNEEPMEIEATELVAGDIIILAEGDKIPCDGFLIHYNDLRVDESSMTGENLPVEKSCDKDPLLLSNTTVLHGSGEMIATALGINSMWGQTLKDLQDHKADDTPLQEYLDDMAEAIGKLGLTVGFICFFILAVYWAIDTSEIILEETWSPGLIRGLIDAFIIGVTGKKKKK